MWYPKTARELETAIANGALPRESAWFEVKQQLPATRANSDIAVDIGAMGTDGGVIVYGVAEDRQAGVFTAHPITLQGLKERISQVVGARVKERLEFEVNELALDADPSKEYIVVVVPASVRAPHMVEGDNEDRFYGREPGGNRRLSEAEIAQLYQRRQRVDESALRALGEAIALAPIEPEVGRADLHLVILPLVSDSGLRDRAMEGQSNPLLIQDVHAGFGAIRFAVPWDPNFADIISGARPSTTLDGVALLNPPIERSGEEQNDNWVSRLELCDNGTFRYFHAAVARDWSGEITLRDGAIAQIAAHFCVTAGRILERGGYGGPVEALIAVLGAKGAVSAQWQMGNYFHMPSGKPTVTTNNYRQHERVLASKLVTEPTKVAQSLTDKLLRTIRPSGWPDPLALKA